MRGGVPHDLLPERREQQGGRPVKYRCRRCGEGYQVRTSAPSCRIPFLLQMEQLIEPYGSMETTARRAMLEELVRRRFRWPRPLRDAMLEQFERWQAWKTGPARSDSDTARPGWISAASVRRNRP
jgi:hypothetical protein